MRKHTTKALALILSAAMLMSACGSKKDNENKYPDANPTSSAGENTDPKTTPSGDNPTPGGDVEKPDGKFTYTDSVATLSANWNPHTYQTNDERYPMDFINSSLYALYFNDELHPEEGKEPYSAYTIVPEMAKSDPVDITEEVKKDHPEFHIPDSATSGYAWKVALRDDLMFDNGTKITADTYVESLKRLLDPKLLNYRAADVYNGTYAIANAKNYALAGSSGFNSFTALGKTCDEYLQDNGNSDLIYINIGEFWSVSAPDGSDYVCITDETPIRDEAVPEGEDEDYISGKYLWDNYLGPDGVYHAYADEYTGLMEEFEDGYPFEKVGLYKSGDNDLVFVFNNSLSGFYLKAYAMSTFWLVEPTLYDKCLKETDTASGTVWSSTYCTNVENSVSYGPYKMSDYQLDKSMHFVRNDKWFGYNDNNHNYVDPEDGKTYAMYQTDEIDTQVITEAATRKSMFLSGQLMVYGLQAEDFDEYRTSEFCYDFPGATIFFMILNGYKDVIEQREAADDFDTATKDLQSITNLNFRKAMAVSFDKKLFVDTIFPADSVGFGLIGQTNIYDPETCAYYRDTDVAKQALTDFYSVDVSKYSNLDEAVNSITGYDPETAKKLFNEAFKECIDAGYITDKDGDGICDQTIEMQYSISSDTDRTTKMIDYFNEKLNEVTKGSAFDGKIKIVKSAPLGNDWANQLRSGLVDIVLSGWTGSEMDPFGTTDVYVNPDMAYDGYWFDATTVNMTLTLNGEEITLNLYQWSDALNGNQVTVKGKDYNFGYGVADAETRLQILAGFEKAILGTYDYIPMINEGYKQLLTQQAYYVVEDYNPVMSRGGIQYLKYNYNDDDWAAYVKEQGGTLKY